MSCYERLKSKLVSKETAFDNIQKLKANQKEVVFTNGCFDILHVGHVTYLSQARDLGDFLILGLNTDESVKLLNKAPNRPINSELARATVLAALESVDLIVLFNEETPLQLIEFLLPTILVKGNDYDVKNIVGYDAVVKSGGRVLTLPFVEGFSTTKTIGKMKEN
ncbi:MAG: D-glycero-beta-D-manno-heptose 1-phosphate adenylyltransferase [Bacteroidetes bacterium]|jgi:rfaE bifunctional protein nucleotidyltransferase chain/domain|nr:D-glycero-beta-D-manno-heptose 1-phosphate adenylyltransferase [Bacteroidota bacterium]MCA6443978.1 D-glycero-beta-D-manno-heptose 1-phosphate adenylyltransferase [Bacteroidota bacterium]